MGLVNSNIHVHIVNMAISQSLLVWRARNEYIYFMTGLGSCCEEYTHFHGETEMQQYLISTTFSSRDAAVELLCMARCMEPAVWSEMLWWQLLKMWLHEILVKLCYSQWSVEYGRIYLVFICIKMDCKE